MCFWLGWATIINNFGDILINSYTKYDHTIIMGNFNVNMLNMYLKYLALLAFVIKYFDLSQLTFEITHAIASFESLIQTLYATCRYKLVTSMHEVGLELPYFTKHGLFFVINSNFAHVETQPWMPFKGNVPSRCL